MQFKMDDYELYQPEYDANGNCISGCAYPGINIIQEHETSNNDTQQALQQSESYQQQQRPSTNISLDTRAIINAVNTTNDGPVCINRNVNIPVGQVAPFGKPLIGNPRISSPYGPRTLHGKQSYHDGIDFAVPIGTKVYSPADATVVRVINDNRCGKGLRLKHNDGTQSIYCHLNSLSKRFMASDPPFPYSVLYLPACAARCLIPASCLSSTAARSAASAARRPSCGGSPYPPAGCAHSPR